MDYTVCVINIELRLYDTALIIPYYYIIIRNGAALFSQYTLMGNETS